MRSKTEMILLSVMRTSGWVAGGVLLTGTLLYLDLELNMFCWSPEFSVTARVGLLLVATALFLIWFTAKRTSDAISHFIALAVSVLLMAAAICAIVPEPSSSGLIFGRRPSPWWYRAARSVVLIVPLWLWILLPLRARRSRNRDDARET